MKRSFNYAALFCGIIVGILVYCNITSIQKVQTLQEEVTTLQSELEEKESSFDTTYLEDWCGDNIGTVRMVGAWVDAIDEDSNIITLCDETGNLWEVSDVPITEMDYLLLWIDDNGTTDNVHDDDIVKLWVEPWC
jgi:hypothetical protein